MANKVTIDVEARFVDRVTAGMNKAANSSEKLEKAVKGTNKALDKLGRTKAEAKLGVNDKATSVIGKVTGAAKAFAGKTFRGSITMADKASHVIGSVTGAARSFAGKTFSAAVKIIDYATTPLRKIKDSLFSIKSLIAAITAGFAAKQFVINPINLADQYSGAKIGFSTLLGDTEGQAMMDEIDAFAKATPFKTSNTIASIQKMMAYGWDAARVIEDMKVIGDAAAATGKGDQGLESIVYALSEIRSKGKLSTQELNQLASAGIKAKAYLAEGLGFGTSDAGMAKLAEALEDGAVGANQAIEMILEGMKEFDGMMDRTANETVEGLWSQLQDTFEINIFRKWGQGLQDGAKKGFGSVVDLLNTSESALEEFGDLLYDIGKEISNWSADKLGKTVQTIKEITATDTWKNASLKDKVEMLWDGAIGNPFSEWWSNTVMPWWDDTATPWLEEKAQKAGESIGKGLTVGLLTLFGATDKLDGIELGSGIAGSFVEGFKQNFDGSAITEAFVDAIGNVWDALPWWGKMLLGGYGVGKAANGYLGLVNGAASVAGGVGKFIGSTGNAMVQGTGLLNILANAGYAVSGGSATAGGYFGASTAMTGGKAALLGGATIAGGVAAGASALKGGYDLYKSYKAYKAGDITESNANFASGGSALGGVATGAAIGSIFGPAGTIIGAGIGGIAGWFAGSKMADKIRKDAEAAKFETEAMKEAVKDTEKSAEEIAMEFEKVVNSGIRDHFGDIKLSMDEIQSIAKRMAIGDKANEMTTFVKATELAEANLKGMQSTAEALDRLNWKVGLGLKLDEKELEEYRASIDSYITSAKGYVEDKHYEFTAAVTLLMDVTEGDGKTILDTGNAFYANLKEQIDGLGSELSKTVEICLKDGVITFDEKAEIINLQNQIAEITNKLANAETEAAFEAVKIKFGGAKLSSESFQQLQEALNTQLEESSLNYENALKVSLTNLELQHAEKLISDDEYKRLKGVLEEQFNSQMEDLNLQVQQVQIEIIGEAYEDVLGTDAVEKLNSAIQQSIKEGISPAEWTTDDVRRLLGADSLSEEAAAQIAALLSGVEFEVTTNGKVKIDAEYEEPEPWKPSLLNTTQKANVGINPAYDLLEQWKPSVLNTTQNANVSINPSYNLLNAWTPPSMNRTIYPTITVSPSYKTLTGAPYKQNANGSIVQSKTLSWVGEEGPEAIIPLVPGRRARGLKLWEEAGRRLGVQYHAEGGIVGGDSAPIQPYVGEIQAKGDNKIEINMGGVTIEIKADSNKSMVDNIEDQEQQIAEKVAEIFKNVLSAQFANTPLKGAVQ